MKFIKTLAVLFISIIVLVAMIRSCNPTTSSNNSVSSLTDVDTSIVTADIDIKTWQYSDQEDEMTSKKTYYASLEAEEY